MTLHAVPPETPEPQIPNRGGVEAASVEGEGVARLAVRGRGPDRVHGPGKGLPKTLLSQPIVRTGHLCLSLARHSAPGQPCKNILVSPKPETVPEIPARTRPRARPWLRFAKKNSTLRVNLGLPDICKSCGDQAACTALAKVSRKPETLQANPGFPETRTLRGPGHVHGPG